MSKKRRKKNKKRDYLTEWDGTFFHGDYSSYIFSSTKPADVHKIAEEIFGKTYYIDFDSIT